MLGGSKITHPYQIKRPVGESLRVRLHALFSGLLGLAITLSLGGDAPHRENFLFFYCFNLLSWPQPHAIACKWIEIIQPQWTAFGMMNQRTLLQITVGCYFAVIHEIQRIGIRGLRVFRAVSTRSTLS